MMESEFDADHVPLLIERLETKKLSIETLFSTFGFTLPDITAGVLEEIVTESLTRLEQLRTAAAESNVKIKQHSLEVLTNFYKATCGLLEKFQKLPVSESA